MKKDNHFFSVSESPQKLKKNPKNKQVLFQMLQLQTSKKDIKISEINKRKFCSPLIIVDPLPSLPIGKVYFLLSGTVTLNLIRLHGEFIGVNF